MVRRSAAWACRERRSTSASTTTLKVLLFVFYGGVCGKCGGCRWVVGLSFMHWLTMMGCSSVVNPFHPHQPTQKKPTHAPAVAPAHGRGRVVRLRDLLDHLLHHVAVRRPGLRGVDLLLWLVWVWFWGWVGVVRRRGAGWVGGWVATHARQHACMGFRVRAWW